MTENNSGPTTTGLVHGRFQPFHNDHLKFILAAFEKVDFMYVGITNPDPRLTSEDSADSDRSRASSNPCTYYERQDMVISSLMESGMARERFTVVPFPINFPELWKHYAPQDALYFLTIYDEWGERKFRLLKENGLEVDVLWRKPEAEKGITASGVRENIALNRPWQHLVPAGTARSIIKFGINIRIKEIFASESGA